MEATPWDDWKDRCKFFVGSLPAVTNSHDVLLYFSNFGHIDHVEMKRVVKEGRPDLFLNPGYCSVFASSPETVRRILAFNNHTCFGRKIVCKPYVSGQKRRVMNDQNNCKRVILKNVPKFMPEYLIKQEIERYGEVDVVFDLVNRFESREFSDELNMAKSVSVQCREIGLADWLTSLKTITLMSKYRIRVHRYKHSLKKKVDESQVNDHFMLAGDEIKPGHPNLIGDNTFGVESTRFTDLFMHKPTDRRYHEVQCNSDDKYSTKNLRFNLHKPEN